MSMNSASSLMSSGYKYDQEALENEIGNHYFLFENDELDDTWYFAAKNPMSNDSMMFMVDVLPSLGGKPVCHNECSGNGKCSKDLVCSCESEYFYKDCSVKSTELKIGQINEVKLFDRRYYHFITFQDKETSPRGQRFRSSEFLKQKSDPIPITNLQLEIEYESGIGIIYVLPDNQEKALLPSSANYKKYEEIKKGEKNEDLITMEFDPDILEYQKTTRVILLVEPLKESVAFNMELAKLDKCSPSFS